MLLALNAFFVGAEFALISARRTQIEPRAQAGSRAARTTLRAMENITLMMAGAQLGITICSLGLGAVGEPAVAHLLEPGFDALGVPDGLLHPISFVIALLIVVFLHVVLGEMVPKNIALAGPDRAALVLGPPMLGVVTVLRPLIVVAQRARQRLAPADRGRAARTRSARRSRATRSPRWSRSRAARGCSRTTSTTGSPARSASPRGPSRAVLLPPETLTTVRGAPPPADVEALCAATGFSRFPVVDDAAT